MSRKIRLDEANVHSVARNEILQIADMVARDKGIEIEPILTALEDAILKTAQMQYGEEKDLEVMIDRKTGEISVYRLLAVSDSVEDFSKQISLKQARLTDSTIEVGDVLRDKLPALEFGRVASQSAKQILIQKLKIIERDRQYEEFSARVGEIIAGVVKRVEYSGVILDIGRTEGMIRKSETIPNETFKIGDRVKVFFAGLNKEQSGPLLQLSRTSPEFLKKLFEQEVPEIYDGVIRIVSVARDPGSKAKIAVTTSDHNLDPIGACVGVKGSRVQSVVNELKGEKVDIIAWEENPAIFIVNSLSPAEVSKIVMEETGNRVTAIVPDEQLSLAIGRRGQNVRLASKLTGWTINVVTESEESKERTQESSRILKTFMENLDVDEMVAHLLIGEGYSSVEDIAMLSISDIASIEGFDEDISAEIKQRATLYLERKKEEISELCKEKGVSVELKEYKLLTPELLEALVKADIKTLDDLGDLSTEELLEVSKSLLTRSEAETLIMKIRDNWFK
ncbi:MAG: transcription termination factor NusA [Holosporales bacterium]|nr:transcription termination factor NusA [Holosporales bacterium]